MIKNIKKLIAICMVIILIIIIALAVKDNVHIKKTKSAVMVSSVTAKQVEENEEENGNENENNVIVAIIDNEEKKENNIKADKKEEPVDEVKNEEKTDQAEDNVQKQPDSSSPYYIKVNYQANVVTIYKKDNSGKYTVPYKAMICSTGSATPHSGTYIMPSGYRSKGTWGLMVGGVYAQYYTRIVGSILFHSVPYTKQNKSSLEYWEYDKLGTTASAGCVRLTVEDAKWIYNNCPAGTQVDFYADSNPGPLGKPTAKKISDEKEVRNWDPTDPDSRNPWKDYEKKDDKKENKTTQNNTTTKNKNNTTSNKNNTTSNVVKNNSNSVNTTKNNTSKNNTIKNSTSVVNDTIPETNNNITENVVTNSSVENEVIEDNNVLNNQEVYVPVY